MKKIPSDILAFISFLTGVVIALLGATAPLLIPLVARSFNYEVFSTGVSSSKDVGGTWKFIGSSAGVDTYVKEVPNSNVLAMRGVADVSLHISSLLGPFTNVSAASEWIYLLTKMEEHKTEKSGKRNTPNMGSHIIYQHYDFPFPAADRDFVMHRSYQYMDSRKTAIFFYESVADGRFPPQSDRGTVRGETPFTKWIFESLPPAAIKDKKNTPKTRVQVESLVDNKGSLPSFLVNHLQKSWPSKSITALVKLAEHATSPPLKRVASW